MGAWEDRLKHHVIHEHIKTLKEALDRAKDEVGSGNEELTDTLRRSTRVVRFIKSRLNQADPLLVTNGPLGAIDQRITNALQQLNQYFNDKNINHINVGLTGSLDQALAQIHSIPIVVTRKDAEAFSEAASEYNKLASNLINEIKEYKQNAIGELQGLRDNIKQLSDSVNAQKSSIETQAQRIDNLIADQQEKFTNSQQDRGDKFSKELETRMTNFESSAQETLDSLIEYKQQASDIVQIIGNIGVTGNYQKIADQQEKTANWLRLGAIAFFIAMVVGFATVAFMKLTNGITWDVALYRLIAALVFAVPAGYLAFESNRHRNMELTTRRIELELASLNPYLESIEPAAAEKIKEELAPKYFGTALDSDSSEPVSPSNLIELMKKLIDALAKNVGSH